MNEPMQSALLPQRPLTILIAAMGGEGGGMLADWLVAAARYCDYPVQSTSIPGVAQRTGGTTYYVEIYPMTTAQLGGREPVMALMPTPGGVDVVAASELTEAGRAMQRGYVGAATTLIAATHRVYTVAEKSVPGDGRADSEKMLAALKESARCAVLFDMAKLASQHGAMINAVLFGALAGSGALPLSRAACERAIREAGKGAEASLRGFAAGYEQASGEHRTVAPVAKPAGAAPAVDRVRKRFPAETFAVLEAGVARLIDYQDQAYADLYIDRMEPILTIDREAGGAEHGYKLTRETGRLLALWMSYEDLIRVADLKTRKSRFERLRAETGAGPDDVVTTTEYLKPGLDEICSVLPQRFAQRVRQWAVKNGKESFAVPMHIKTTSMRGFLLMRAVSSLRRWRRQSSRYAAEHKLMERWLGAIKRLGFAVMDVELALEIAECARLVKGYGETHRNGVVQFEKIFNSIIESGTESDPKKLTAAISRARKAALGLPDANPSQASKNADPGKPIFWMPRKAPEKETTGSR
ncbi:indolepyruvate oxidoreductase subunit beta family protein [Herbaspirillum sp. HC18]|nr:indolepyruvate oxidoreductase subunit beta family protein [Herbaspirillum sp. HC18]